MLKAFGFDRNPRWIGQIRHVFGNGILDLNELLWNFHSNKTLHAIVQASILNLIPGKGAIDVVTDLINLIEDFIVHVYVKTELDIQIVAGIPILRTMA